MFTRKDQLNRKGGPAERFSYLTKLKDEFLNSKSFEAKKQVLANLANFAYDPINYDFFKQLQIIDLFLSQLSENSEELIEYAISGLCNLCIEPENREYIIRNNGIFLISEQLLHRNEEISVNAFTTLIYLITPENNHLFTTPEITNKALSLQTSQNQRLRNITTIFLTDFAKNQNETNKVPSEKL